MSDMNSSRRPNLCLRVGPFESGGGTRMVEQMDLPGLGVSVTKLADRFEVIEEDGREFISIEISPGGAQAE